MSNSATAPRPLPAWFAKSELAVLRVFAAWGPPAVLPLRLGLGGAARLLATPFLRLMLLIAAFIAVRDRLYVALSIVILAVLFAGFLGG